MKILAAKEEQVRRMAICQACPFATTGHNKKYFCSKCGCVLQGKVMVQGESCPAGKW